MPAALTATRTSPADGTGTATSACVSFSPMAEILIAFMFATTGDLESRRQDWCGRNFRLTQYGKKTGSLGT